MALPKVHRLRRRHDFRQVYRAGLRRSCPHLVLRAIRLGLEAKRSNRWSSPVAGRQISQAVTAQQHVDRVPTQIGISISTKVSKRATVRNRIKRQIQAAMVHLLPTIPVGWMIVVVVKPGAEQCDYWQFLRELEEMVESLR